MYAHTKKNKAKPASDTEELLVQQMSQASLSGSQQAQVSSQMHFGNVGERYGIQPESEYMKLSDRKKGVVDRMVADMLSSGAVYSRSALAEGYSAYFRDNPKLTRIFKESNVEQGRFDTLYPMAQREYKKVVGTDKYKIESQQERIKAENERKIKEKRELEQKRHAYIDGMKNVWSTNEGYRAMKSMSAGKTGAISGSEVIAELARRHGEQQFTGREGARIASSLSSMAGGMSVEKVSEFNRLIYNKDLGSERENYKKYYRGTRVPAEVITGYRQAKRGDLFRSRELMAVSSSQTTAKSFMNNRTNSGEPLLITIIGFSAEHMRASLVVSSEAESLFSTFATFRFVSFSENHLVLEETESSTKVKYILY
ncbi:TPA: hypothetical protein ACKQJM_003195 [Serratia marcescens]